MKMRIKSDFVFGPFTLSIKRIQFLHKLNIDQDLSPKLQCSMANWHIRVLVNTTLYSRNKFFLTFFIVTVAWDSKVIELCFAINSLSPESVTGCHMLALIDTSWAMIHSQFLITFVLYVIENRLYILFFLYKCKIKYKAAQIYQYC